MRGITFLSFLACSLLSGACESSRPPFEPAPDAGPPPSTDAGLPTEDAPPVRAFAIVPGPTETTGFVPPLPEPRFVEVTEAVGIDHDQDPRIPEMCTLDADGCNGGWHTGGAAAGDLDGDGWPDLYFAIMGEPDRLYLNDGDGTFTDRSAEWGLTDATFTGSAAMHDVDRDGDLDVYVTGYGQRDNHLLINTGSRLVDRTERMGASFAGDRIAQATSAGFGDIDGDRWPDVCVVEWNIEPSTPARVLMLRSRLGDGGVGFDEVSAPAGLEAEFAFAPAFVDLDDDGLQDLYISGDFQHSRMFWNEGDGTFTDGTFDADLEQASNAMGLDIEDVDLDGDFDIMVTSLSRTDGPTERIIEGQNRLYINHGDRRFTEEGYERGVSWGGWGWGVAIADLDHDGDPDMVQTAGYHTRDGREFFFENDGTGHFIERGVEVGIGSVTQGRGLVLVDYDRDGDDDVLIVQNGDAPILYRNDLPRRTHWLRIRALDPRGADALGARVIVRRGERSWHHHVSASGVFNGSHEPWIDVGLGAGDADSGPCEAEVEVRFPGGAEVRQQLGCDDWHVIREPG
ncbi:MAG: VCBS repeat-containing protein [Myxococcota bacterium]